MNQSPENLLQVRAVSKRFPGVQALDLVNLSLRRGEILALIGENGAGKTTLMKILAGIESPDRGRVSLAGQPVTIDSPRAAQALGIALIHQELNLAENLSVAANMYLGREPRTFGFIRRRLIHSQAKAVLTRIGIDLSPRAPVHTLSIGRQQLVEIARALSADARILIMDEPTSSLSQRETERLFAVIRELRASGVSIIYISHRLGEVKMLADRVLVLRDGRNAGELPRDAITHDAMVRLMVGRDVSSFYARKGGPGFQPGEVVLRIDGLVTPAHPAHEIAFEIRAGEIVGLAGLVGAGRTELLRTIFGIDRPLRGTIRILGRKVRIRHLSAGESPWRPVDAIRAGLALVPEDRKQQGVIVDMAVRANISLARLRETARAVIFRGRAAEQSDAQRMIRALNIRTPHDRQTVRYLSGGNQQKVVLAKWLALRPRVLLMDEPTRGIDVGAKEEIYRLMEELAQRGVAVLFASSEMEEILGMCDRVLVMHEGRLAGDVPREKLAEETIMRLATGA